MPYCHLSGQERDLIAQLLCLGHSFSEIAVKLGRHKSTISREYKRNKTGYCRNHFYAAIRAQALYKQRRREAKRSLRKKIIKVEILRFVKAKLKQKWSPEQIAGRLREERGIDLSCRISHVSIYKWIKEDKRAGGTFYKYLRQSHRQRRMKYGSKTKRFRIEGRVSIDDRPKVVNERRRIGDWEGDLMEGKNRTGYLLTYVERKTGFLLVKKILNKSASTVRKASIELFRHVKKEHRRSITFDNGSEFSEFKLLQEATGMKIYFAHPYSSWERGTNENTNGLIRQYVPKGKDIRRLPRSVLALIRRRLNNRPRKRLGYRTPSEVLLAKS